MFRAEIEGKRHRFRVEGKYRATHILRDDETGSLWTPAFGHAVYGPLKGNRLERLHAYQCIWREYKELRPDTLVAGGQGEPRDGHGSQCPSPDSTSIPGFVNLTRERADGRLPEREPVLGVEASGRTRAYPLALLHRLGPVVEDRIDGLEIAIVTRPGSWLAAAFDRSLAGRPLRLRGSVGSALLEEAESGSRFDLAGLAVSGPLAGQRLRHVPSGVEKWCSWSAGNPGTEIFSPAANREDPLDPPE